MDKQEILNRLDMVKFYRDHVPSLKVNDKQEATGLCCFHDDDHPSLSVNVETGLFHCFSCDAKGDVFDFYKRFQDTDFPTALKEIGKIAGAVESDIKPKVVAKFEYKDATGSLLYIKERLEPGRNGRLKEFIFKHLEGNKCVLGRGCDPVLYNLPELVKSKYCFIVEGEAKADLLNSWGLVATCLDSGANSPIKDEYIKIFRSMQKVIVLPDNDTSGGNYAYKLANALHSKVKELKVVELLGLSEAEDVLDWSKIAGNDKSKLIEIVKNASEWIHTKEQKAGITLTKLSALLKEPAETTTWLVDGILPSGGFSICVAKPKVGKSTFARTLGLHVAKGESFLNSGVTQGAVIYLALEEKRAEVKKHFLDMGANGDEELHIYTGGTPVDAIKQIREATERLNPVLIIIDPLFRLTKVKDGNDYIQVTNALDPLLRLARDSGVHVLCVHHSSKGQRDGGDSVLGSTAIFGTVDTLMVMKRHEHYRTLQTIQRYGDDLEETILNFDRETRTVTIGGTRQEQDVNMMKKAIIAFLLTQTAPVTEPLIVKETEGNTALKRKAIRELVSAGGVKRDGKGSRGDPFLYSRILVPDLYVKQEYENKKMAGNPHGCKPDSRTDNFTKNDSRTEDFAGVGNKKNEGKNEQKKLALDVPFAVESIEVEA